MKPTRTTVGRPQEMLLYASRRCRSTTSVQCLGTFQLGGVHSIHHQIFESQLIIRHCFSFFLLKDAMISDGLGMADLCVGRRTFAMPPSTRRRGERRTSTLVPSDAAGRGHAAMRQVFGPWSPPHSFFLQQSPPHSWAEAAAAPSWAGVPGGSCCRRPRRIPCAGCVGFPDVTFAWPILPCVYIQ